MSATNYIFVTPSPQGTWDGFSGEHRMPNAAARAGAWGRCPVLLMEDPAFLLEGCMERFGDAQGGNCNSSAWRGAYSLALMNSRMGSVADDLAGNAASPRWMKNRDLRPPAQYYVQRTGSNGLPYAYPELFGIDVECTSGMFSSRPLVLADVEKCYRDLRRYECEVLDAPPFLNDWEQRLVHRWTPNADMPECPEPVVGATRPMVYGWRYAHDRNDLVFAPYSGVGDEVLAGLDLSDVPGLAAAIGWHVGETPPPDLMPYICVDFTAYVRMGSISGDYEFRNYLGELKPPEPDGSTWVYNPGVGIASAWYSLVQTGGGLAAGFATSGAPPPVQNTGVAEAAIFAAFGAAGWDEPPPPRSMTQARLETIMTRYWGYPPLDDLLIDVYVVASPRWISNVPDWRTPLHKWIAGTGAIIPANT